MKVRRFTILSVLFVSLCLVAKEGESMPLDEFYVKALITTASLGEKVAIVSIDLPKMGLYLFDFGTRKVTEVKDGRVNLRRAQLLPYATGFALFQVADALTGGGVTLLSKDGAFERSIRFSDIKGFEDTFSPTDITPGPQPTQFYVSYQASLDTRYTFLGMLDMEAQEFKTVNQFMDPQGLPGHYWGYLEGSVVHFSKYTGLIELVDPSSLKSLKVIQQGQAPVEAKEPTIRMELNVKLPDALRYKPQLLSDHIASDYVFFAKALEEQGSEPKAKRSILKKYYLIQGGQMHQDQAYTVARYNGLQLLYDEEDNGFSVSPIAGANSK